ncbi:hypothetical protein [Cellulophaga fucicola]|uniref:SnoaL-like domain-containing protein n=1 Tax=Cellulophaga fucicola TaxID=76595 RepID=A0A1K1QCN7_9FLAO|nr:hypothetical protein [Cellulophaga fucicola]SFW57688.1 hypothetical protein SAMN05660313_02607 [Cellulophaga fucicola]
MKNLFTALFLIITLTSFCPTNNNTPDNEALIKLYIKARNNYKTSKIITLVDKGYKETFVDGSLEIKDLEHLKETILFQKGIESKIKLISLESTDENTVTTIEEYSSYIDIALGRKLRTFKIIYTIKNGRILNQKMIPLKGYDEITEFNIKCWGKFTDFCSKNKVEFDDSKMNYEMAVNLKQALEKYLNSKK